MSQNHASQHTVIQSLDCLLLLLLVVELNPIVNVKDLHDLPLLLLAFGILQQI